MADVPDYDSMDEAFPALPPPHSPGQEGPEGADLFENGEDGDVSKLADVPAAKRKGVKRPQPKLDSQRLISERGLPALRTLFDNVRFKGKGHEAEDLKLLMQKMENWAHRLFPKLQFEDFIDKVEKLGTKKEVQTCLKRIRLDMPLTPQDFMGGEEEEPAAADPESRVFGDPDPFSSASFNDLRAPVHSTPAPPAPASPPATSPSLTEEQRERMELNRRRALERRTARQQQPDPSDSQTVDWSTSAGEPPSVSSGSVLNISKDQGRDQDEEVEASDPEPASTQHTDSEPPAAASGPPPPAAGPPPPAAAGPPSPAAGPPPPAASGPPSPAAGPPSPPAASGPPPPAAGPPSPPAASGPPPPAAGPPPPAAAGPPPPAAAGPPSPAAGPPSPAAGPPSPPAASGPPPPAVGPPLPPVGPPPSEEEEGSGRVQVQEDGD